MTTEHALMHTVNASDMTQLYRQFRAEFDDALQRVLDGGQYIGGTEVIAFEQALAAYVNIGHIIGCANGTDALQLALMALDLPKGSKIIVPAFTYIAPVEVIRLLGYDPVYCDADPETFNCTAETISNAFVPGVQAILPVHLFGQCAEMAGIESFARQRDCFVIEDNAQSLAADRDLSQRSSILTTSFFPTKNLGGFGDGGAVLCNDAERAARIRQLANHGQARDKYMHERVGINSRLDAIQAAFLQVKLKHLDTLIGKRQYAAAQYDTQLAGIDGLQVPVRRGTHTFHQYTLRVDEKHRDNLQRHLLGCGIPCTVYYPVPAYRQKAFEDTRVALPVTESLCRTALSLPMHSALDDAALSYICETIRNYFTA